MALNPDTLTPPVPANTQETTPTVPQPTEIDPLTGLPVNPMAVQTPIMQCQHNALFFATPGHEALIQAQEHQMELNALAAQQAALLQQQMNSQAITAQ